jgi:hypothetical protein
MSDQSLARQLVPLAKVIAMTSSGIATGMYLLIVQTAYLIDNDM